MSCRSQQQYFIAQGRLSNWSDYESKTLLDLSVSQRLETIAVVILLVYLLLMIDTGNLFLERL